MERVILIVEDDDDTQHFLKVTLTARKYKVDTTYDAFSAQKYLMSHNPDLILIDIMMPGMNGLDLCRWIRSQDAIKNTPIIQMSALRDEGTIQDSMELGVMDYITKPLDLDMLQHKIEMAFKRVERRNAEGDGKDKSDQDGRGGSDAKL